MNSTSATVTDNHSKVLSRILKTAYTSRNGAFTTMTITLERNCWI